MPGPLSGKPPLDFGADMRRWSGIPSPWTFRLAIGAIVAFLVSVAWLGLR